MGGRVIYKKKMFLSRVDFILFGFLTLRCEWLNVMAINGDVSVELRFSLLPPVLSKEIRC
jgi:hypothetical protein